MTVGSGAVNKITAWVFAVGASMVLVVGATVVLGGQGGSDSRHVTSTQTSTPATGDSVASPATTATAVQVQEVLARIMTQAATAMNGRTTAQTPAEIEVQLRTELAKLGLHT